MWRWPSSPCPPAATAAPVAAEADAGDEDRGEGEERIDFATVVFQGEIPLLRLQARSIARFLDPRGVGRIFVIVNDRAQEACVESVRALLPDYGALAPRVEIVTPEQLSALRPARFGPRGLLGRIRAAFTENRWRYPFGVKGGWRGNRGWAVQQAFKLAIARRATGAHLVILDAKNHFIRPVFRATFVAPDGRARTRLAVPSPKHRRWKALSSRRLGLEPRGLDDPALPTLTPFVVPREGLLASLEALEAQVGPVESFFARKRTEESEFAVINAVLSSRPGGLAAAFAPGLPPAANLRPRLNDAKTEATLAAVERGEADMLSVHKRRLGRLSPPQRARLEAIWSKAGLDATEILAADANERKRAPR